MTCKRCIELYLSLDNGEAVPRAVQTHLAGCERCMAEVAELEATWDLAASLAPAPRRDLGPEIMGQVRNLAPASQGISVGRWVVVGMTILASLFLIPFGRSYAWGTSTMGLSYEFPLLLILGVGFTGYCSIFIGTHVDELSKLFKIQEVNLK